MLSLDVRIARAQRTLRWLEEDESRLPRRVAGLSRETQESAKQFAATMTAQARAELRKLIEQNAFDVDPHLPAPAD